MDVAAGHTLTLDGQQGSDGYQVITTGSQGDPRNYVVNVLDTGQTGIDGLTVYGTGGNDIFLLRRTTSIRDIAPVGWPAGTPWIPVGSDGSAFIALLRTTLGDAATSDPNADPSVRPQDVQRVNYDLGIDDPGSGAAVVGLGGDDTFAVDGTSADVVLDGGDGNDTFQIGQVYGSKRDILQIGGSLEPEDLFPDGFRPIPTVRGWLSRGNSLPLVANGGGGDDTFKVYADSAPLSLLGGPGANVFESRAFALAQTTGDCTDVTAPGCQFVWRDEVARVVMPLRPAAIFRSVPVTVVDAASATAASPLWDALLLPGERNEPLFEVDETFQPGHPAISKGVSTSANGPFVSNLTVYEGTTVYYRIVVSNPGDSDLTGITLTDSLVADLTAAGCTIPDTLAAGASFPCDYSLVAVRGTTTNTATADSAETDPPVTDSTTVVGLRPPVLTITKGVRADPAADFVSDLVVPVGTTVTYRITVTNAGDVAVDGITLVDDHSVLGGCASRQPGRRTPRSAARTARSWSPARSRTGPPPTAPRPTRRSTPARGSPAPRSSRRRRCPACPSPSASGPTRASPSSPA